MYRGIDLGTQGQGTNGGPGWGTEVTETESLLPLRLSVSTRPAQEKMWKVEEEGPREEYPLPLFYTFDVLSKELSPIPLFYLNNPKHRLSENH